MTKTPVRALSAAAATTLAVAALAAAPNAQAAPPDRVRAEHQRILDFWTPERLAKAQTRDVELTSSGEFRVTSKPVSRKAKTTTSPSPTPTATPSPAPTTADTLGADWAGGGLAQKATGKVYFQMNGSYYVCSATAVKDANAETSSLLTAAHCVYDNATKAYATNWMFVPDWDDQPAYLSTACSNTLYGCWTGRAITLASGYANQSSFNSTAALNDFAFVTVGAGGKSMTQLDQSIGAQDISFTTGTLGATVDALGYPAQTPWDGNRLIYSQGGLQTSPEMNNLTYRVPSTMNGGCSGGPWLQRMSNGAGVATSINSYTNDTGAYMHGPKFTATTQALHTASQGATTNSIR